MLQKNHLRWFIAAAFCLAASFAISASTARAAGTFQLLNFPTSTTVTAGQQYNFYISFLYSGNNIPNVSLVGNPLPDNQTVGVITPSGNGLYNVQVSGKSSNIGSYPLTLELTDNYGAFFTQPFTFIVNQVLPMNTHATSPTTYACNTGYEWNGVDCQLPPNGTLVGGALTCNAGYVNYSGTCELGSDLANDLCSGYAQYNPGDGSALGSYTASGILMCNCPPNETWNSATSKCNATPVVVPTVTAPIQTTVTPAPVVSAPASSPSISITANLSVGASGQNVIALQTFLIAKGFLMMPADLAEGYFGGLTKKALIAFQQSVGLPTTGYCGSMTRALINKQ